LLLYAILIILFIFCLFFLHNTFVKRLLPRLAGGAIHSGAGTNFKVGAHIPCEAPEKKFLSCPYIHCF